jgi:2-polyprenyl-6-methoxyphenol hydroxylase-like FAD-dependent oxidoreductase
MTGPEDDAPMAGVERVHVTCCVGGGGPAGMMLGLLLARAGVDVLVLEKHADFLRDFRGDTIHPSTLEVLHELGVLDRFLRLPHQEVPELRAQFGDEVIAIADFRHLPTRCGFVAFIPQWDFLDFLRAEGERFPSFRLRMRAEVVDLIEDTGRVVGLRATTPEGPVEVRADLVVAADGRSSIVREKAGLPIEELGAPMDVLWFRLSRRSSDPAGARGRFDVGRIFLMLDRGEHWQYGYVIPKGALEQIRGRGLDAFRREVATLAPFAAERVSEIGSWDEVKLLAVRVDRAPRWYRPGLLCIGDAAHAMSPVGGVGINLAIQDAVAAANLLAGRLRDGQLTIDDLRRVQRRRELPTRVTQRMQVVVQNAIVSRALHSSAPLRPPLAVRLIARVPALRRLTGRLIGLGIRPEHVRTPVSAAPADRAAG